MTDSPASTQTNTPTTGQKSGIRVASLDLLRFGAAVAVMVYHFAYSSTNTGIWAALNVITRHGYLGVELFFIISGFVVLWSAKGRSAFGFARARVLRLYPEFWLAVLLSAVIFNATGTFHTEPLSWQEIAANLTMLPQYLGVRYVDGVYWTLGVEIKFYALLGLLIGAGQLRRAEYWIFLGLAVMMLGSIVDLGPVVSSLTIGRYGALFAAGGLFFVVFEQGWNGARAIGLCIAAFLSVHNAIANMPGFIRPEDITPAARLATASLIAGMYVFFLAILRLRNDKQARPLVVTLGALTYPLYLLHNTGKAVFIQSDSSLPLSVRILLASLFSFTLAYGVFVAGTRVVRPLLSRVLDPLRFRR